MFNHNLIKRSLAAAAVVATAGFPTAAQATLVGGGGAPAVPATSTPFAPPQPVAGSHSSFQWGDAGIGAAGAVALLGAGAIGVSVTRRRRTVVG